MRERRTKRGVSKSCPAISALWGKPQDRDTSPSAIWTVCSLHCHQPASRASPPVPLAPPLSNSIPSPAEESCPPHFSAIHFFPSFPCSSAHLSLAPSCLVFRSPKHPKSRPSVTQDRNENDPRDDGRACEVSLSMLHNKRSRVRIQRHERASCEVTHRHVIT